MWSVIILAAKARITTANGLTPPRAKLNGLLILTRLVSACLDGLSRLPNRIRLIRDTEYMISSVESGEGILAPYFTKRCDEIEEHMNKWRDTIVMDPLYQMPGSLNINDLATRGLAKDEKVDIGYMWQEGPVYLKYKRRMATLERLHEQSTR